MNRCSSVRRGLVVKAAALVLLMSGGAVSVSNASTPCPCPACAPVPVGIAEGDSVQERIVPLKQVDVRPEFPGGRKAMSAYAARCFAGNRIEGRRGWSFYVRAAFIVEKDGTLSGFRLKEHFSEKVTKAMLDMLSSMPRWTPGKVDGKPVRTGYSTMFKVPWYVADSCTVPEFMGGKDVLLKYIYAELKKRGGTDYSGKKVKIIAQFTVNEDGSIGDVNIKRHGRAQLDDIVLDVLRSMPRWKPGTVDGQPVSVRYTLPVTFGKNK